MSRAQVVIRSPSINSKKERLTPPPPPGAAADMDSETPAVFTDSVPVRFVRFSAVPVPAPPPPPGAAALRLKVNPLLALAVVPLRLVSARVGLPWL